MSKSTQRNSSGYHPRNELQVDYYKLARRSGSKKIRSGKVPRKSWSLAILPATVQSSNGSRPVTRPFSSKEPLVNATRADFLLLADRPAPNPNPKKAVVYQASLHRGYLDEGGAPSIGGREDKCLLDADFAHEPQFPPQLTLSCRGEVGAIRAPRSGKVHACRRNGQLELWVEPASSNGYKSSAVDFRLPTKLFAGGKPAAHLHDAELPKDGQTVVLRTTEKGAPLAHLNEPADYEIGLYDGDRPRLADTGKIFPAHRRMHFRVLNAMNSRSIDETYLLLSQKYVPIVTPRDWVFGAFVVFEDKLACNPECSGDPRQRMQIETASLTCLPGFVYTQALKADFLRALGPGGKHYVKSEHTGTVEKICFSSSHYNAKCISFYGGGEQVVPATAVLRKGAKLSSAGLAPGMEVRRGDVIGDAMPRAHCQSWELVEKTLDGFLHQQVDQFIKDTAIKPRQHGWRGPGVLFDVRYVTSILEFAKCEPTGEPMLYWDFRRTLRYLDPDLGAIVLPPVHDDTQPVATAIGGVQVFLGAPCATEKNVWKPRPPVSEEEDSERELVGE